MQSSIHWCCVLAVALAAGCDYDARIKSLEKENQELKEQIKKQNTAADLDLQAKCSRDARVWFNENWSRDKDTVMLNFTNHYNKEQNKCFIVVEHHFRIDANGSWTNDMTLWDVYENSRYGSMLQSHVTTFKPTIETKEVMLTCEVLDKKCTTLDQFNGLIQPYLNN